MAAVPLQAPVPALRDATAAAEAPVGAWERDQRRRVAAQAVKHDPIDGDSVTDDGMALGAEAAAPGTAQVAAPGPRPPPPEDPAQMGLARYIISSLEVSTGSRVQSIESSVTSLKKTSEASARDIASIQARLRSQEAGLEAIETGRASSAAITAASRPGLGGAPSMADPWSAYLQQQRDGVGGPPPPANRPQRLGKNAKHVVFVADFPGTWDKEDVERHLTTELAKSSSLESQGIREIYGVGRFCDQAKVVFADNDKGQKIPCQGARNSMLWHKVDQEPHEVDISRKVSFAVRILGEFGVANGLCTEENKMRTFDGDRARLLLRARNTDLLEICQDPMTLALLNQELSEMKLQ
ncbi:unnamed protein product, partial [Prorocentrum cordatum]